MGGSYPPWTFISRKAILGSGSGSFRETLSEGGYEKFSEATGFGGLQ